MSAPTNSAADREAVARAILDGWYEGNVDWSAAPEHWQHSAFLAADAVLALLRSTPSAEAVREACAAVCRHTREIIGAATGSSIGMALSEAEDRIRALNLTPLPAGNDAGVGK